MRLRRLLLVSLSILFLLGFLMDDGADSAETNIAPDKALFRAMTTTPVDTAVRAVSRFVEDPSLTGKVAELHGENITFAEQKEYADESTRENIEMFWKLGYA
jgi:hypothetical protein